MTLSLSLSRAKGCLPPPSRRHLVPASHCLSAATFSSSPTAFPRLHGYTTATVFCGPASSVISFLLYPKDQNQTHTKTEYTWFPKIGYSTEVNWSYYQTVGSFTSEVSYLTTLSYIATAIEPHWSLWFFGTGVFDLPFLFWEHFCLFFPLNFLVWFSVLGIIWFCNAIFDLNLIHPSGFFFLPIGDLHYCPTYLRSVLRYVLRGLDTIETSPILFYLFVFLDNCF